VLARRWGLKPQTARALERAAVELVELLAGRRVADVALAARLGEDRVELTLAWDGDPLPERRQAHAEDLLGAGDALERFMLWAATREAIGFTQRRAGDRQEARVVFED
jgi:hypothetical protein